MSPKQTEVLVVGAGIAGCVAALECADQGLEVILVDLQDSATAWAQGGIVYKSPKDPADLVEDILKAGVQRNYRPAVELVASEGPEKVKKWLIDRAKVPFDESPHTHEPDLALEAAHSSARILHVKDQTGASISKALFAEVQRTKKIQRITGVLVDLIRSNVNAQEADAVFGPSVVVGAYVLDPASSEVSVVTARAVILATGGFAHLYQHATGPRTSRGDGIAAAHRVGARTLHLEYVQFHPTALYVPGQPRRLLTEALRGAGARVLNPDGKPFLDPLAPRDVVARGIHQEMHRSRSPHVWLDLSPVQDFPQKFPAMDLLLRESGFDPSSQKIPIVPAAHYTMGGVWTDLGGATSVPGLFAAGEVACTGLHGANRLASTSLLEALVFGERAAMSATEWARSDRVPRFTARSWRPERGPVDPALVAQDWQLLRQTLWNYVGLVRSEKRLRRAERILGELRTEVESFYKQAELSEELIGLRHASLLAQMVLYAALKNPESVGSHFLKSE